MAGNFNRRVSSRPYLLLKTIVDLIIVNFLFVVTSVLSLFVLFFPGIVALTTVTNRIINSEYYHPFLSFFAEIKAQWSFMWRLEVAGMSIIVLGCGIGYMYYAYIQNFGLDFLIWFAIALAVALLVSLVCLFFHLVLFNEYFKDDTFWMMVKKAGLIARKKAWLSLVMALIFVSLGVVCYLIPYLIPFLPFSMLAVINIKICHKTYQKLVLEDEKKYLDPKNLFLPKVIDSEKRQDK